MTNNQRETRVYADEHQGFDPQPCGCEEFVNSHEKKLLRLFRVLGTTKHRKVLMLPRKPFRIRDSITETPLFCFFGVSQAAVKVSTNNIKWYKASNHEFAS